MTTHLPFKLFFNNRATVLLWLILFVFAGCSESERATEDKAVQEAAPVPEAVPAPKETASYKRPRKTYGRESFMYVWECREESIIPSMYNLTKKYLDLQLEHNFFLSYVDIVDANTLYMIFESRRSPVWLEGRFTKINGMWEPIRGTESVLFPGMRNFGKYKLAPQKRRGEFAPYIDIVDSQTLYILYLYKDGGHFFSDGCYRKKNAEWQSLFETTSNGFFHVR